MELANAELEQRQAQAMADARVRESLRIAMDPRCEEETLFLTPSYVILKLGNNWESSKPHLLLS